MKLGKISLLGLVLESSTSNFLIAWKLLEILFRKIDQDGFSEMARRGAKDRVERREIEGGGEGGRWRREGEGEEEWKNIKAPKRKSKESFLVLPEIFLINPIDKCCFCWFQKIINKCQFFDWLLQTNDLANDKVNKTRQKLGSRFKASHLRI